MKESKNKDNSAEKVWRFFGFSFFGLGIVAAIIFALEAKSTAGALLLAILGQLMVMGNQDKK